VSDHASKPEENLTKRSGLVPFAKGNPGGPGRKPLPSWFRDLGDDALRVLAAQATGVAFPQDDGTVLPAVQHVALESSPKERASAAAIIADRIYGKAPETVTLEGELAISRIVRTIVDPKDNG
jgi:hypothetical protein